jgi:protein gp37
VPSNLKGLSLEPLFEPVSLEFGGMAWVIVGGGSDVLTPSTSIGRRISMPQCKAPSLAFFLKQAGKNPFYGGKPVELT